ncbi:MAG: hypothetical protein NC218_11510 [Acetobacter sp.]|nr:hypothetical protein [Acetobacter sp.]
MQNKPLPYQNNNLLMKDWTKKMIQAYTDASFDKENNIAGIGIVIINGQKRRDYALFVPCRTANAGELFAIQLANILTHGQATIYTDSQTAYQYIINGVGEKKRTREQYLNHLECKYWAYQIKRSTNISVIKVKAHKRHYNKDSANNMVADSLAFLGRSRYNDLHGR